MLSPRRRIRPLWLLLLLLSLAQAAAAATAPLDVSKMGPRVALGDRVQVLADPQRNLTLTQLLYAKQPWRRSRDQILNFSFSGAAYWVRFNLGNPSAKRVTRVLEAAMPLHDYFDVYLVDGDRILSHVATGDRRPFASRPVNYRNFLFPLIFAPGQTLTVYLHLDTHDGLYDAIPLNLWRQKPFFEHAGNDELIYGFYYGALLALLLYNLFLFLSTRERMFFYYALYLSAFFVWNFTFRGYAYQYLWPDHPLLNNQMVPLSGVAIYLCLALFSTHYLDTRRQTPRIHRIILWLSVLIALPLVPALLNMYALPFALLIPVGMLMLPLLLGTAVYLMFRGYRPARYFVLAWSVLVLGALLYYLRVFGVIAASPLTENALNIGSALEFLLLSFGVADQINRFKQAKLEAEERALDAQRALSEDLDHKVSERTRDLEELNQRLALASATDALTGLHNRRSFNELFERELNQARREHAPLALCLVDVDLFKNYNDACGHQQGDEALRAVAGVLREALKRAADYAFRIGGEEFALLLTGEKEFGPTRELIESIRIAIEALGIPHPEAPPGHLTASFGLHWVDDVAELEADQIFAAADQALYAAKRGGRNRVVTGRANEAV